jgi:hypothetical protein
MIASRPVIKAEIPAAIPASIVSAKAGLAVISAKIVPPAETDLNNEFVNDEPMINNSGIAMMSPTDHFPNAVIGKNLQVGFVMFFFFHNGSLIQPQQTEVQLPILSCAGA